MAWRFKVSTLGKDTSSNDLRDLSMHSDYSLFKYHMEQTITMTLNGGDTEKIVSFNHNLGYVPSFIAYMLDSNSNCYSMPNGFTDSIFDSNNDSFFAYADSTKIYIKCRKVIPVSYEAQYAMDGYSNTDGRDVWNVGNNGGTGLDGALWFYNVQVTGNESIIYAKISPRVTSKGSSSSDTKFRACGIDEDNTANFSSYPLGRSQTSANTIGQQAPVSVPFGFDIDVTSSFNEIRQRAGWSSGNNMGFFLFNNGSDTNAYLKGDYANSRLIIQKSGSINYGFRVIVFKDKII